VSNIRHCYSGIDAEKWQYLHHIVDKNIIDCLSATVAFSAAPPICASADQKFRRRRCNRRAAMLYFRDNGVSLHLPIAALSVSLITSCNLVTACVVFQLWKRSGAWFYKGLPRYIKPPPKKPVENSSMRISAVSPASRNSSIRSSNTQGTRKTYSSWSRSYAPRELLCY